MDSKVVMERAFARRRAMDFVATLLFTAQNALQAASQYSWEKSRGGQDKEFLEVATRVDGLIKELGDVLGEGEIRNG